MLDVTARKKAEDRLSLLAKASNLFSAVIDCHLPSLLQSAVQLATGKRAGEEGRASSKARTDIQERQQEQTQSQNGA
jgi:hypothetical protein